VNAGHRTRCFGAIPVAVVDPAVGVVLVRGLDVFLAARHADLLLVEIDAIDDAGGQKNLLA
jgi:hypothetical protein